MPGHCLSFDHVVDRGWLFPAVQSTQAYCDLDIRMRLALIVANIIDPSRQMVALRPDVRFFKIAQQ